MKRILLALFILSLSGCGANHGAGGSSAQSSLAVVTALSIDTYASTVYSFGQNQGCVNCHAGKVNPLWMNPDPAVAYSFARPFVDFANPTASVFATYVGNNHCNDPICNNKANIPVMQSLLSQWALIEIQQGTGGTSTGAGSTLLNPPYVTATLAIPNPLPLLTAATPAVLRFALSQLTPPIPALNGAYLEVSVRSYNTAQNEYRVYNPRIFGNSVPVHIEGIHAYVRPAAGTGLGTEDVIQGDQWSGVNATAGIFPMPGPLPAGPVTGAIPMATNALGIQSQSSSDVITLGFAVIQ